MSGSTPAASSVAHVLKRLTPHRLPPDQCLVVLSIMITRAHPTAGISQAELARQLGILYQRAHQIVHGPPRRGGSRALHISPLVRPKNPTSRGLLLDSPDKHADQGMRTLRLSRRRSPDCWSPPRGRATGCISFWRQRIAAEGGERIGKRSIERVPVLLRVLCGSVVWGSRRHLEIRSRNAVR